MAWTYLAVAGVLELGWPVGLKLGWTEDGLRWGWVAFSIICMAASGAFLMLAQRAIPIGTAYAVWTGIGTVGTFVIGVAFFGDATTLARFFFVGLIAAGIIGLRVT